MNALNKYKRDLINLGQTNQQKRFIESSFARWYFNVPKTDILPLQNMVERHDLEFANQSTFLGFDIPRFLKTSEELFRGLRPDSAAQYPNLDSMITTAQLARLKKIYKGRDFEGDKNKLLGIYNFVGINSIHLSIPPIFKGTELFGSPLNTHNQKYCSPFAVDKLFRSSGSFFNFTPKDDGVYLCNPPFDEEIIRNMAVRLLSWMAGKPQIVVICTVPVWDSASQRKLGMKDYGMQFEGFDSLIASKFCYERDILMKNEYPYWDYYSKKSIPASHTHLIFLSNCSRAFFEDLGIVQKFKENWKKWALEN